VVVRSIRAGRQVRGVWRFGCGAEARIDMVLSYLIVWPGSGRFGITVQSPHWQTITEGGPHWEVWLDAFGPAGELVARAPLMVDGRRRKQRLWGNIALDARHRDLRFMVTAQPVGDNPPDLMLQSGRELSFRAIGAARLFERMGKSAGTGTLVANLPELRDTLICDAAIYPELRLRPDDLPLLRGAVPMAALTEAEKEAVWQRLYPHLMDACAASGITLTIEQPESWLMAMARAVEIVHEQTIKFLHDVPPMNVALYLPPTT